MGLELNKIYKIKHIDGLKLIDNNSIDLIVTDPPFNQGKEYENHDDMMIDMEYFSWCNEWIKRGFEVLKDSGSFYIQINSKKMIGMGSIMDKYGIFQNAIIWIKHSAPTPQERRYAKNYQTWLFYTKTHNYKFYPNSEKINHRYEPYKLIGGRNQEGRRIDDIWEDIPELTSGYLRQDEVLVDENLNKLHKQQMPIALARRAILHSSDINDIVLDPFIGSGTTAIAALETNRNFIGFEQDNNHFNTAIDRINNYKNQMRF